MSCFLVFIYSLLGTPRHIQIGENRLQGSFNSGSVHSLSGDKPKNTSVQSSPLNVKFDNP